jgi:integrase
MINGVRHQLTRRTKREAQEAIAELVVEASRRNGSPAPRRRRAGTSATVAEHLERWIEEHAAELAESTAIDYRRVIDTHLVPHIGDIQLVRLHQTDLNDLYKTLRSDGLGTARIRRVHNCIAAALEQALQDDIVADNVARRARPPKVTQREIEPPTPEQVVRIVTIADEIRPGLAMFVHLAAVTGARRGELLALRWSDIAEDQRGITLTISRAISLGDGQPEIGKGLVEKDTKTHAVRRLRIDAGAVDALLEHRDWQIANAADCDVELVDNPRLFAADPDGERPWRPDSVSRWFNNAVQAAGLTGVRLHDLRHAAATQMLAAGVDVVTGANRLGHRNRSTFLNRYAHVVPAADEAAADTLGQIYRRDRTG